MYFGKRFLCFFIFPEHVRDRLESALMKNRLFWGAWQLKG